MLNVYEATPEPSVLLACGRCEPVRALAVILEGFGYNPLECAGAQDAERLLSENIPCIALVCLSLSDSDQICKLINQRDDLAMLILLDHDEKDPDSKVLDLRAHDWEYMDASAESILLKIRELLSLQRPNLMELQ